MSTTKVSMEDVARDEWLRWRCADMPVVYQALIRPTCSAAELLDQEMAVRLLMARDMDRIQEGRKPGPVTSLVLFEGMTDAELAEADEHAEILRTPSTPCKTEDRSRSHVRDRWPRRRRM